MITIVRFQKPHGAAARKITTAFVRRRLDAEARRLRPRYRALQLSRDPRLDVFAAADFDNTIGAQLGFEKGDNRFAVVVLGRGGELLAKWSDVPPAVELAGVLK